MKEIVMSELPGRTEVLVVGAGRTHVGADQRGTRWWLGIDGHAYTDVEIAETARRQITET
jgi:hypothetical protein